MSLLTERLHFTLPPELEAHEPPEARGLARDQVRLLVSHQAGDRLTHAQFRDLPRFLQPGDLLVANDSATIPAALTVRDARGGEEFCLHLSTRLTGDLWAVEPRETQPRSGAELLLPGGGRAPLLAPYGDSRRLWVARLELPEEPFAYLARWGWPIAYSYLHARWPIELYQTVYAREPGSAEMPSAGRPFTQALLARLARRGVGFATLTLHTGVASLEAHELPYPEQFRVPAETAEAVRATRAASGRVIAIGTTVVRALESAVDDAGRVITSQGWTDLVITPERGVRVVDGLLTGFHEPEATHLAMLAAIASRRHLELAYQAALAGGYLWHEFGDLHLLLP
ncbi:MAG TPA: S-adenosylmethionine:tRNA ribosyltransferase-isomerase [Thermomicrobiaceae bacterium]|nr:S-adenosylmethionine:tRNA ribosyltransferase-isomerase [Thermomicrobiaceae bacterium]